MVDAQHHPDPATLAPGTSRISHIGRSSRNGRVISSPHRRSSPASPATAPTVGCGDPDPATPPPNGVGDRPPPRCGEAAAALRSAHARRHEVRPCQAAVGADEAALGQQPGDEKHIHLTRVVEHEVRLVYRGKTRHRRCDHASGADLSALLGQTHPDGACRRRAAPPRRSRGPRTRNRRNRRERRVRVRHDSEPLVGGDADAFKQQHHQHRPTTSRPAVGPSTATTAHHEERKPQRRS